MALKSIFQNIFGTEDENEGFVDYDNDDGYDVSSSAVTEREADYNTGYSGPSSFGSVSSGLSSSRAALNISGGLSGHSQLIVLEPKSYEEVMTDGIARLKEGTIIFLKLAELNQEVGTRIVDFMTGAAAMCDGRIRKIDTRCYAVTPKGVEWINTIED